MNLLFHVSLWNIFYVVVSDPQSIIENDTELNTESIAEQTTKTTKLTTVPKTTTVPKLTAIQKILQAISVPITKVIAIPKISNVLRNIGTCLVNGAMEIISYYLPAPFLPLVTSVAGKLLPFEPIITLRRLMPVTSYRKALKSAVNGFLSAFNRFKFDEDPYMSGWFRRRYLNDDKDNKM